MIGAAADVFAAHGYEGGSIAEIARTAGLSTGAIYGNFASKAELLAEVVETYATSELNRLLADETARPTSILDLVVQQGSALERDRPATALLPEAILASRRDPDAAEVLTRHVSSRESLLAEVIGLAQSSGEASDDVPADVIARFCLMLGLGSLLVRAMDLPRTDPDQWSALINRLVDSFRAVESTP